jgi:hypothetical protein
MSGFLKASETVVAKNSYDGHYQQASVKVSISEEGKVSWTVTMTNDSSGAGRGVYLSVKIAGKSDLFGKYYTYSSSSNSNWRTFPTGDNTTKSGSFELDNSTESVKVEVYVCCMRNSTSLGNSKSINIVRTAWTNVGKGTITITDHYNNKFSVSGAKGANGTNNPATGPTISWGYTSSYGNSGAVSEKALTITDNSKASRKVYAKCVTGATYGSNTTVTAEASIKQYVKPSAPGKPVLSYTGSNTGSRLTVKSPWTFKWTAATKANDSSPIKGYRIRLYKNGTELTNLGDGGSNKLIKSTSNTNKYLDRDSTSTTVIINDPASFGFKAGDTVQLSIFSYTKMGKNNDGTRIFHNAATAVYSEEHTIQNAGIVSVMVDKSWKEGQVYVNVNGSWKEAESINVNVNGAWKEST